MLKSLMTKLSLSVLIASLSWAAHAMADGPKAVDVPPGDLVPALERFEQQAAVELVFQSAELKGFRTHGVKGTYEPEEAIRRLLLGTPLELRVDPSGAMLIASPRPQSQTHIAPQTAAQEPGKTSSQDFRVAQLAQAAAGPAVAQSDPGQQPVLEEVLVSAQKREERLHDVPISMTAIAADSLVDKNQLRLQDYYSQIPGLTLTPNTQSGQLVALRGITTGTGNPTVGITVDDVPFGSSTFLGGGQVVPDFDPSDLARIEVLRGPQGTLYGASSMGGLLKFVTVDPSTAAVSGRIQADGVDVQNGASPGYGVHASINVPLGDALAIRASGFSRQDPGYIDNPLLHIDGINKADAYGGHLSALWLLSDSSSLKLSALYQDINGNGLNDVDRLPGLGDLQQSYLPGVGSYDRRSQAYSATLKAKLWSADLTSVSGYNINSFSTSLDASSIYGPLYHVAGVPVFYINRTSKFSQEIRLDIPLGDHLQWLLGGFYTHESSPYYQSLYSQTPGTGNLVRLLNQYNFPTTYAEDAAFTDLTYHFTDRFDIQAGGRESFIRQSVIETGAGGAVLIPSEHGAANAFTYLVTPRYRISPDVMVYARLASGYRAGGLNFESTTPGAAAVPLTYSPDKTQDYEIGAKGDLLARRLSFDVSLYYIDWKDIQLTFRSPQALSYTGNGGGAESEGVELSSEFTPVQGLKLGGWVVFNRAVLTEDLPPQVIAAGAFGVDGDRLPLAGRFSGSLSVEEEFPLLAAVSGFAGAVTGYVGDRLGRFAAQTAARQDLPGYAQTDLRIGVRSASWSVSLFANNVTDKRGMLNGGTNYVPTFAYLYIQPRTLGLSAAWKFE